MVHSTCAGMERWHSVAPRTGDVDQSWTLPTKWKHPRYYLQARYLLTASEIVITLFLCNEIPPIMPFLAFTYPLLCGILPCDCRMIAGQRFAEWLPSIR